MQVLPRRIPVIYYHSIGPIQKNWNRNYLTLEPANFEKHLKYYKENYSVIDLKEYYKIRNGEMTAPKNPVVITIDDGYLDNWIWAFPLLKKYNLKATIFVSPEFVDPTNIVRPNSEDVLNGRATRTDLSDYGFMSWQEMALMEKSGLIDIQSHTMAHTKYFISDKIKDFHHPNSDGLYPIGNIYPDQKPFHIANEKFEKLIPYGTPFFEEKSSVIAKRITINPAFNEACIAALKGYDFKNYAFADAFKKVKPVYESFLKKKEIVLGTESDSEYRLRLKYEIAESKKVIETKLNKQVDFLSWPHGDNSIEAHEIAMESGYKATTIGKLRSSPETLDRIGERFGFRPYYKSAKLGFIKLNTKIRDLEGNSSATVIKKVYQTLKKLKK